MKVLAAAVVVALLCVGISSDYTDEEDYDEEGFTGLFFFHGKSINL